jgi:peptide/nickel transport system substrate-binding protein
MTTDPNKVMSLVGEYMESRIDRRQFLSRALALGVSGTAASAILAACGSPSSPSASISAKPPTTTLTYRPQVDIQNLDPAFYVSQDDTIVTDCIFEGLVTFRPGTWTVVNNLAESFEPSSDNLRFHFKLKKGVEWQKGYGEVRASDVKYSYERIAGLTKPNLHSPYSGDWSALETVQVTGPFEGTIILKQPFAPLMSSTMPVGSGKVLPQKAIERLGKSFATNPVGSGPYEFVSWVPKQHTILKRFDRYSGANRSFAPKAPWDTIETQVIASDNTAFAAAQTGTVAFAYIPPSLVSQAQRSSSLKVYSRPSLNYNFLSISQKNVPNIDVRRAIRSAIDVPGVIKAAYNGRYQRAYGIIPPSMKIGYWAAAPHYNQDLTLAKHYLASSGMKNVSLTLTVDNLAPDEAAAQVIAANLQQIGIKVKIQAEDSATIDAIPGNGGGGPHRQLVLSGYVTEPDPYWSFIWFTCAQMGLWNWCDWCNPQFTSLLNQALKTYDPSTRDKLYIEAAKLWDEQANIVWIAYPTLNYATQRWVRPSLRPDGYPNLWSTTAM